jgi:hypothetical protein
MTDPPRRRNNDLEAADLYPKMEEAIAGIARLDAGLANHRHTQLEKNVNQIIDVLEGAAVPQLFDQPAVRNDGLVDKVDTLVSDMATVKDALGNGGVKVRLPVGAWVAIVVAVVAGVSQIIAAIAGG